MSVEIVSGEHCSNSSIELAIVSAARSTIGVSRSSPSDDAFTVVLFFATMPPSIDSSRQSSVSSSRVFTLVAKLRAASAAADAAALVTTRPATEPPARPRSSHALLCTASPTIVPNRPPPLLFRSSFIEE